MTDTFSTPAEHAFEHDEIEAIAGPSTMGDATEELTVEEAFEVEDTIKRIREGGYRTVSHRAWPDSLRGHKMWNRILIFRSVFNSQTSCCRTRSRFSELFRRVSQIQVPKPTF